MRRHHFLLLFLVLATPSYGYVLSGQRQPDGTVKVVYDCGKWNDDVPYIVSIWNEKILRTQLMPVESTTHTPPASGDGVNTIAITNNINGAPWPDGWQGATIATTDSNGIITEFDLFINDAYAFRFDWALQSVLLHELGHALGLAHLPFGTQAVSVMNGTAGGRLGLDDVAGVQAIYGVPRAQSQLLNMSTRGLAASGDNAMIAGFTIYGHEPKRVLIRVLGPSLAAFGIANPLKDPTLELYRGNESYKFNDDWFYNRDVWNTGLNPESPVEAVILVTLDPGAYTAVVRGKGNDMGVAVVEVYDLDQ